MTLPFLPYGRQWIDQEDVDAVVAVLTSDWLTTGPAVSAFERELAQRVGARYAVACTSGTAALHLAAMALDLGPEDIAITSPITFLASANAARFCGADVLFADVDPATANLDPAWLEASLASCEPGLVKAIIPVHFAGCPAAMGAIKKIADAHGARIIEDGCHALGATYQCDGKTIPVGSCHHSAMTVFSFHPVKHITTGEGGAITTNDEALHRRLTLLRSHGMTKEAPLLHDRAAAFDEGGERNPWYYEMSELGYNYRLSDIQAALGRTQLGRLDRFLAKRRALVARYEERLASGFNGAIRPLASSPDAEQAYHLFVARIDFTSFGLSRGVVMRKLHERGIGTQVHYIPVNRQPYYRERALPAQGECPNADAYYEQALSLPLYPLMGDADVDRVVEKLQGVLIGDGHA